MVCPDDGCPDPGLTGFEEATRTTEFAWRLGPPPPPCSDDHFEGRRAGPYPLTTRITTAPPPPGDACGDGICGAGESCDGRASTEECAADCPGRTGVKPSRRFCRVEGVCEGPGC